MRAESKLIFHSNIQNQHCLVPVEPFAKEAYREKFHEMIEETQEEEKETGIWRETIYTMLFCKKKEAQCRSQKCWPTQHKHTHTYLFALLPNCLLFFFSRFFWLVLIHNFFAATAAAAAAIACHLIHVAFRFRWYASEVCAVCWDTVCSAFEVIHRWNMLRAHWPCLVNYHIVLPWCRSLWTQTRIHIHTEKDFKTKNCARVRVCIRAENNPSLSIAVWNVLMAHHWSFYSKYHECRTLYSMINHKF